MLRRLLAFLLMMMLAACGGNANVTPEAIEASAEATEAAEVTEASSAALALILVHQTPLAWGGTASFAYPADWSVRDTSSGNISGDITVFSPDGYNLGVSISNDPSNTDRIIETRLNALNQSAVIETVERDGRTIYYTDTRFGNAWAAAIYVDGTSWAYIELVNTRQRELEPMYETVFAMLLSVQIMPGE